MMNVRLQSGEVSRQELVPQRLVRKMRIVRITWLFTLVDQIPNQWMMRAINAYHPAGEHVHGPRVSRLDVHLRAVPERKCPSQVPSQVDGSVRYGDGRQFRDDGRVRDLDVERHC